MGSSYTQPPTVATTTVYCHARCTDGVQGGAGGEQDFTWDGTLYFEESETIRNASNKKQLIIPTGKTGKYRVKIICQILNNGIGTNYVRILINGTETERVGAAGPAGAIQQLVLEWKGTLTAGDVITATCNISGAGYFIGTGYGGAKGGTSISVESWV